MPVKMPLSPPIVRRVIQANSGSSNFINESSCGLKKRSLSVRCQTSLRPTILVNSIACSNINEGDNNNSIRYKLLKSYNSIALKDLEDIQSSVRDNEDKASACDQTTIRQVGIPLTHAAKLAELSKKMNLIFGFRPIDPLNTQLIIQKLPTKPMRIKAKTSNWGPMAGFICVNQSLSKLVFFGNKHLIDQANEEIEECLDQGLALTGFLTITTDRLSFLCENKSRHQIAFSNSQMNVKIRTSQGLECYTFHLSLLSPNRWLVEYQGEPIKVLYAPGTGLPMIADYDLMLVAPSVHEFDHSDTPINPEVSYFLHKQKIIKSKVLWNRLFSQDESLKLDDTQLLAYAMSKEVYAANLDPTLGNLSKREKHLINEINTVLECKKGFELVHHGAEAANPFSVPEQAAKDNYPAVFFLPYTLDTNGNKVCRERIEIIKNTQMMKQFVKEIKDAGYVVHINPSWEKELQTVRSSSYETSRSLIKKKWQGKVNLV